MFGAWKALPWVVVAAAWGGLIIGGVYMLRAIRSVLHGKLPDELRGVTDATSAWRRLPFALMVGGLLFLGMFPSTVTRRVEPEVARVVKLARPAAARAGGSGGVAAATDAGR